jgi:hypothetical protein
MKNREQISENSRQRQFEGNSILEAIPDLPNAFVENESEEGLKIQ